MKRTLRRLLTLVTLLGLTLIAVTGWFLAKAMPIGTGYTAKYLCTAAFLSGRDPLATFVEDVKPINPLFKLVRWRIDRHRRSVSATAFTAFTATAVYREGCGCTLLTGITETALRGQPFCRDAPDAAMVGLPPDRPWPLGDGGPVDPGSLGVNRILLEAAVERAFAEPGPEAPRKTRAVAVVYEGQLIAERYAPGINADTPMPGWSMSKSVTNALVGILVGQGRLAVDAPAPVPEWRNPDDPKHAITLDQLMHMSSGLVFEEVYGPFSDATDMFFRAHDFGAYAAQRPLDARPGEKWHYASGTANIIARIVRETVAAERADYIAFLRETFFDRIGMLSAVLEPDASGTFVGSSYIAATVRDWARFGQLYLQDGVWNGERILPEGWVDYSTAPAPKAPRGEYGALFWLNAGAPGDPGDRLWPDAPMDAYAAQGFQEQKVIVVPSKRLVLVRLGATSDRSAWDTNAFIADVLRALPDHPPTRPDGRTPVDRPLGPGDD